MTLKVAQILAFFFAGKQRCGWCARLSARPAAFLRDPALMDLVVPGVKK